MPDYFGDIYLTKAIFRKYLKEKCWIKSNQQLSFKYFVKLWSFLKLFSKVSKVQTCQGIKGLIKKIYQVTCDHNPILKVRRIGFCPHLISTISVQYWIYHRAWNWSFFFSESICIFKSYLNVLCIETSTSLGSLQIVEKVAGEFKEALGLWLQQISSP